MTPFRSSLRDWGILPGRWKGSRDVLDRPLTNPKKSLAESFDSWAASGNARAVPTGRVRFSDSQRSTTRRSRSCRGSVSPSAIVWRRRSTRMLAALRRRHGSHSRRCSSNWRLLPFLWLSSGSSKRSCCACLQFMPLLPLPRSATAIQPESAAPLPARSSLESGSSP